MEERSGESWPDGDRASATVEEETSSVPAVRRNLLSGIFFSSHARWLSPDRLSSQCSSNIGHNDNVIQKRTEKKGKKGTCCRVDGPKVFLAAALASLWISSVVTSWEFGRSPCDVDFVIVPQGQWSGPRQSRGNINRCRELTGSADGRVGS